ncbi:uroporphyrin-III C-methyltransferase [Borealophlyctis nickersoniae]|nr:uroporphyrin-III C-methyltransferase [Borealophlyctis nickersoniae]
MESSEGRFPPVPLTAAPLPLSFRLTNRNNILFIGASTVQSAQIARTFLASGAVLTVVSPAGSTVCEELTVRAKRGELGLLERAVRDADYHLKDLCVVAEGSRQEAARIVEECRNRRIWVSVAFAPEMGDFEVRGGSSDKHSVDDVSVPPSIATLPHHQQKEEDYPPSPPRTPSPSNNPKSRPFPTLPTSSSSAVAALSPPPIPSNPTPRRGALYLVGAGPGSPDLLTLRAFHHLSTADLIISDRLVSPSLLALLPTPIRFARKVCGRAREAQDEIYAWILEALQSGQKVVRLKGGDPFVFGRGGEEVVEFRKLGYEAVVVPGISSSLTAPLSAGIPVTHRGVADQVVIATGRREDGSAPTYPRYHSKRTAVFLMAMGCVDRLVATLVDELGYPASLPAAVVEKATCADQRVVVGTVGDIAKRVSEEGITSHATLVVGNVVGALGEPVHQDHQHIDHPINEAGAFKVDSLWMDIMHRIVNARPL